MKALIIGAGIGGLCTALCLQKSGHKVQLFEKSEKLSDIGAGIQLGANALKVINYLGLLPNLVAKSVIPDRVDFRAFDSGKTLLSRQLGADYLSKYSAPYLHIHRADLIDVLLGALNENTELILNAHVSSCADNFNDVLVELMDGRSFSGDCLIAADGIRSITKKTMFESEEPQFSGNVAWRGLVSANCLPDGFMDKVVTNFVGPSKHMVIYYLREQSLVNFVGVVENDSYHEDSWTARSSWQALKQDFDGWHPTVQTLINKMDQGQCYRWALYDQKPLKSWSMSRMTLLGDAAHAMLPFLASGAAMAIEDARIIQRSLDKFEDVSEAFRCYQQNRIKRTSKVQAMSRQVSRLYHIHNPVLLNLAFKAVNWKSAQTEAFLGSYDANTVRLH